MTPRIKVCGITRTEDATVAVRLGAAALGFVFWPRSPRRASIDVVRAIAATLPPFVARIGVFVDLPADEVARIVDEARLDGVQLHGDEPPDQYRHLKARLIKAVTLDSDMDVKAAATLPAHVTVLIDATDRVRPR